MPVDALLTKPGAAYNLALRKPKVSYSVTVKPASVTLCKTAACVRIVVRKRLLDSFMVDVPVTRRSACAKWGIVHQGREDIFTKMRSVTVIRSRKNAHERAVILVRWAFSGMVGVNANLKSGSVDWKSVGNQSCLKCSVGHVSAWWKEISAIWRGVIRLWSRGGTWVLVAASWESNTAPSWSASRRKKENGLTTGVAVFGESQAVPRSDVLQTTSLLGSRIGVDASPCLTTVKQS